MESPSLCSPARQPHTSCHHTIINDQQTGTSFMGPHSKLLSAASLHSYRNDDQTMT